MPSRLHLHDVHERLGAHFGEADGYLLPLRYGDVTAEYGAVRDRVGLIDRSHRGKIEVTGRDRVSFLHGMLSNDIKALESGQGCPATFLDAHGKLISLLLVHALVDRVVLEMDRALVQPTLEGLDRLLISERVELEDVSEATGILTLAGPAARATAGTVLEPGVPDLGLAHHATVTVDGVEVRIVRSEESGEAGYDLWAPPDRLRPFWERILAAGARPVGLDAWNVLRVEAGVVWHGIDVDASTLIMEAPLEHTYSLTKGCYVGQEVVARITYRGHVNRRMVGFTFPDERLPEPGAAVVVGGEQVGRITSAVRSPGLQRALALGFLRREHCEPGTKVEVLGAAGPLGAEVAGLPFHRRTS